jgi:glutathione S-transferase
MLKVLGRATSSNVQTVMWAIAELGLAVERQNIGLSHGGNDTAEFLRMNPNGLVPVLIDGDLTLFESAAILRYLAATYGDNLFYPKDTVKRAKLDVWAEWTKTTFYPVMIGQVFLPLVRQNPELVDRDALAVSIERLGELALILDKAVVGGTYSDGENLTFADIMVGHLLFRYFELDFEKPYTPNLAKYYENLKCRPAYREHVMVSYEPLRWRAD